MLYVTFKEPDNLIYSVDTYFNSIREDEWFDDPFVKEIVKGVDNTEILGPELAMSPVLGGIPITQISAGAKALILLLKEDVVIGSASFGDNCTEFLAEIGKMRDCTVYLEHHLHLFKNFDAVCLDDGREIHNVNEWTRLMLDNFKRRNKSDRNSFERQES